MTAADISRETLNMMPFNESFAVPGIIINAALVKKFGKTSIYCNPYDKGSNPQGKYLGSVRFLS